MNSVKIIEFFSLGMIWWSISGKWYSLYSLCKCNSNDVKDEELNGSPNNVCSPKSALKKNNVCPQKSCKKWEQNKKSREKWIDNQWLGQKSIQTFTNVWQNRKCKLSSIDSKKDDFNDQRISNSKFFFRSIFRIKLIFQKHTKLVMIWKLISNFHQIWMTRTQKMIK